MLTQLKPCHCCCRSAAFPASRRVRSLEAQYSQLSWQAATFGNQDDFGFSIFKRILLNIISGQHGQMFAVCRKFWKCNFLFKNRTTFLSFFLSSSPKLIMPMGWTCWHLTDCDHTSFKVRLTSPGSWFCRKLEKYQRRLLEEGAE